MRQREPTVLGLAHSISYSKNRTIRDLAMGLQWALCPQVA